MRYEPKDLILAAAFGCLTGMRSMAGPSIVGRKLLRNERVADLLAVGAVGEMIVDKHPSVPNRNAPEPLIARTLAGAATGAAIMVSGAKHSRKASMLRARRVRWPVGGDDTVAAAAVGAVVGGASAFIATHASYHLRRMIGERTAAPNLVLGAAEDAIVYGAGVALSSEL